MFKYGSSMIVGYTNFILSVLVITSFGSCTAPQKKTNPSISDDAILVHKIDSRLGEGAFWNHKTQELYWVDILSTSTSDQTINISRLYFVSVEK